MTLPEAHKYFRLEYYEPGMGFRGTATAKGQDWNQVETALEDYQERTLTDFPWSHLEHLHVFSIAQHAEMAWREIEHEGEYLSGEELATAIACLTQDCLSKFKRS